MIIYIVTSGRDETIFSYNIDFKIPYVLPVSTSYKCSVFKTPITEDFNSPYSKV